MAEFDGFPKESFAFLSELQSNNSKDWFDQNRDRYDQYWKAPAFALIEALRPHLADPVEAAGNMIALIDGLYIHAALSAPEEPQLAVNHAMRVLSTLLEAEK